MIVHIKVLWLIYCFDYSTKHGQFFNFFDAKLSQEYQIILNPLNINNIDFFSEMAKKEQRELTVQNSCLSIWSRGTCHYLTLR